MFVLTRRSEAAMVAGAEAVPVEAADIVGRIVRCIHPTIVVEEMAVDTVAVDTVAVIVGVVVVEMEEVVVTEELFTAWL
jgi:hypothetical protein